MWCRLWCEVCGECWLSWCEFGWVMVVIDMLDCCVRWFGLLFVGWVVLVLVLIWGYVVGM